MLDLKKTEEGLRLSLSKKGIHAPPTAELAFVLDVSGSFHDEHRDGLTQTLLERLVPWGMIFDPDKKLDVFTFSNEAHYVGDITPETTDGYIRRSIIDKVPGYRGGTEYGPVLLQALKHFGWVKEGFFSRVLGGTKEKKRSIVLFVTDGDNADHAYAKQVLSESEARKDEVYFLFIAIGNEKFAFLEKIADAYGNTGFAQIKDLRKFAVMSDDEVNDLLIGDELVQWLKA